jgi:endonuclease III
MSRMASRDRAEAVIRALRAERPDARVELDHEDPFQLLIATILSARSTDVRVNQVTQGLFAHYPHAAALAAARLQDIERAIHSTGFFRAKARSIQACCRALLERHGGQVPRTMDEMVALPGVGRKTANVVLGAGYGIASGIVVDTHMMRLALRLGLTRHADPVKIERDLMAVVPRPHWIFLSIAGVLHGRYTCLARRPRCGDCVVAPHCPSSHLGRPPRGTAPLKAGARRPALRRRSRDRS